MKSSYIAAACGLALLAAAPPAGAQHDHHGHATGAGYWHEAEVTVTADDTWGIEHCFESVPDRHIRYHIEATDRLDVNFHVHPERDGEYHTEYFMREDGVVSYYGEAETVEPGTYCFAFYIPTGETENREVRVRYRVDR